MRYGIVGLVSSENLGEEFIAFSLSWLIKENEKKEYGTEETECVFADLLGKKNDKSHMPDEAGRKRIVFEYYDKKYRIIDGVDSRLGKKIRKITNIPIRNVFCRIRHLSWIIRKNGRKRLLKYYSEKLKGVSYIIIDGAGLLEYSYNEYQEALNTLLCFAKENKIPIICNAIGRAGDYNPKDFRCQLLNRTFRDKQIIYVSARDSLDSVQSCVGDRLKVKLLADAAYWASEAYDIKKRQKTGLIGIGIIRGNAFQSYGDGISEEKLMELFISIALELESRGYNYEFFTNGLYSDYRFGKKTLEKYNIASDKLVNRPIESAKLIETISNYEGIITCRMHSSIAAFSLGIPSVILPWNDKVFKHMEQIGYPERAVPTIEMNCKNIVNRLEKALLEGVSKEKQDSMKKLAAESVRSFLQLTTFSDK